MYAAKNSIVAACAALFMILLPARIPDAHAQTMRLQQAATGQMIVFTAADGREIRLQANADDDEDGIENGLEVNGYAYSPQQGLQPWNGDSSQTFFRTDPLRWSSDGDPYSDFMEVSGVNMPAGVPSPESHPLVAARPVINISMADYDVILISEITNTEGGEESSSFTNETSSSDEVGGEVTVSASLNPFKLVSAEVTASYSHTWTRTQSSTSTFGSNWSNTRSTNPSRAARLKLRIFMQNLGSATALDVQPTFNLVLGKKTIATITPGQAADRLAPHGLPRSRYPESGTIIVEKDDQNNDLILSLEELKAIQMGAPLGLVVTQVRADVARWNPDTQSFDSREEWSSFEGEIDPVVVTIKANLGEDDIRYYQVYVGTDFYSLGFTFRDVLAHVFEVQDRNGVTFIEGRRYPDDWYVSTPSAQVLQEWNDRGQPRNMLDLTMFRNTQMALMSPGRDPKPRVDLATYSPDFKRVYVSAFPGNFPIRSVRAQVTVNGETRELPLQAGDDSFYSNPTLLEDNAEPGGRVLVENARGDIAVAEIVLPALYRNAAEVKKFTGLLPNPGGEYLLFSGGDESKPVKLFCLFYDPRTGTELATPREYLTLPAAGDSTNFIEWLQDAYHRRMYFSKIRINPDNFELERQDTTFTQTQWISRSRGVYAGQEPPLYGGIRLSFSHLDSAFASVDLTGTPFSIDPFTAFQGAERGAVETIFVDARRKVATIKAVVPPDYRSSSEGFVGIQPGAVALVYKATFYDGAGSVRLPGNSLLVNQDPGGQQGYVNMDSSSTLEVRDAFTIEAWIKPAPHARGQFDGVFINREGEYEIARFADGSIRWAVTLGTTKWVWVNTRYHAPANQWVHVALAYDSKAAQPAIKVYINGNLFQAVPASGPVGDTHQNLDTFRIAAREGIASQQYAGLVDEVRVWKRERTQAEIRATLGDTLAPAIYRSADSGLIGYWRFDTLEDLGVGNDGADDVRDFSVNGNHGDLVGDVRVSGITTHVAGSGSEGVPEEFVLEQNYPNPFNPSTSLRFRLPAAGHVILAVYNLAGQKVAELVNGRLRAGMHVVRFDASGLASGVYLYRFQNGRSVHVKKMTLVR
ncbi:MAG: LamG-like jellyroll fold domain-containing protein [candidate division KSB1 bacterium]|nr:LamG-like jellyroll fold domain-containing protein [candidate division KSB1 bacterium]